MRWPTPVLCAVVAATPFSASLASHTPNPKSVTIAGSLQSELGCSGDWDPTCASTQLALDPDDDVWQGAFAVPAGNWEFKAAINGSWDENYGANAISNGANIHLDLAAPAPATVKFYYDHKTHWITSNQNSLIVTAPGSYQKALGVRRLAARLPAVIARGSGRQRHLYVHGRAPSGSYEVKAALNESWDVNYGAGGAPNGANIPFTVGSDCRGRSARSVTLAAARASAGATVRRDDRGYSSAIAADGEWNVGSVRCSTRAVIHVPALIERCFHFVAPRWERGRERIDAVAVRILEQ